MSLWTDGWDAREELVARPVSLPKDHPPLPPLVVGSSLRGGAVCIYCPGPSSSGCCRHQPTAADREALEAERQAPKTPGSIATVPLSEEALALVREQRRRLMQRGFAAVAPDAFVFTGRNGQPLQRRNALRAWQDATTEALGEALRLHDLRTTLASRLADRIDVPTAQALLRHARPSTTLDVYTRVQGDAAARLDRMRAAINA